MSRVDKFMVGIIFGGFLIAAYTAITFRFRMDAVTQWDRDAFIKSLNKEETEQLKADMKEARDILRREHIRRVAREEAKVAFERELKNGD